MPHSIVRPNDTPEPWDGGREYYPGARCTHKGFVWKAGRTGIYNRSFEPGGFQPSFYWEKQDASVY